MVGADKYMNIEHITGLTTTGFDYDEFYLQMIHTRKLYPIIIEQGGVPLHQADWHYYVADHRFGDVAPETCLVFGNEGTGVPDSLRNGKFTVLSIPQRGVLRSLNVAATASIVMWDMKTKLGWI